MFLLSESNYIRVVRFQFSEPPLKSTRRVGMDVIIDAFDKKSVWGWVCSVLERQKLRRTYGYQLRIVSEPVLYFHGRLSLLIIPFAIIFHLHIGSTDRFVG